MIELLVLAGIGAAALFFITRSLKRDLEGGDSCGKCSSGESGCSLAGSGRADVPSSRTVSSDRCKGSGGK